MAVDPVLESCLSELQLKRLGDESPAGLWLTSLPLPRGASQARSIDGQPTHIKPLGKWWDDAGPRRLLMACDGGNTAPQHITLAGPASSAPDAPLPTAAAEVFEHAKPSDLGAIYWERSMLKIAWGGRWFGLVMGMRCGSQVHWWEHCHLITVAQSDTCLEIEMGGNIPYDIYTSEMMHALAGRDVPWIHKHNWLTGHIYARLHSNGVCEIYARHVNAQFVDDGGDLKDAVAVVGMRVEGGQDAAAPLAGVWDGTQTALTLGDAQLDLTEPAHLATPDKPGRLDAKDDFLVWQPYEGVESFGGPITANRQGDPYLWRGEAHIIPRGMARTLRFSLSLNPERSPRVQRYLAPAWWYGLCEEFSPQPLLPVSDSYDSMIDTTRQWFQRSMVRGGFEDGVIPVTQSAADAAAKKRFTPAAEGDVAGTLMLTAYRTGDAIAYDLATRSCYHHTDVWIDHAAKKVRYQGYTAGAWALPLARVYSCIMPWLEHGDSFCINAAEAVIQTAHWWHKNSWPRNAVGRDAYFGHGAMLLYRYLGEDYYRKIAHELIRNLESVQWPDGSFGDQGGGAGVHGAAAYIVKPWMGWMASQVAVDYLEHFPDDADAAAVVGKLIAWLMSERAPRIRRDSTGNEKPSVVGWTYQHEFRGKALPGVQTTPPPTQGMHLFHFDHMARLLTLWSMRTGDSKYYDAFAESHVGSGDTMVGGYYSCAASFNYLPWMQARLWNARLTESGVELSPQHWGPRTPDKARIMTPKGWLDVTWKSADSPAVVGTPPMPTQFVDPAC